MKKNKSISLCETCKKHCKAEEFLVIMCPDYEGDMKLRLGRNSYSVLLHKNNKKVQTYKNGQAEVRDMQKIAERAIKFICEGLGTCPADNCDYIEIDCENLCKTDGRKISNCPKCWEDYFNDDSNFA